MKGASMKARVIVDVEVACMEDAQELAHHIVESMAMMDGAHEITLQVAEGKESWVDVEIE
jgi:hypothetical protein